MTSELGDAASAARTSKASRVEMASRAVDVGTALVIAIWLGGFVVLGAVVAPTVFRNVPFPASADAMTLVFRRFDRIALVCAALAAIFESLRIAFAKGPSARGRLVVFRVILLTAAVGLATMEGLVLSPSIEALHRQGALRGSGANGAELDRLHRWAERAGKTEVMLLAAYLALVVVNARRRPAV